MNDAKAHVEGVKEVVADDIPVMKMSEFNAKIADDANFRRSYLQNPGIYEAKIVADSDESAGSGSQDQNAAGSQDQAGADTQTPAQKAAAEKAAAEAAGAGPETIDITVDGEVVKVPKETVDYYMSEGKTRAQAIAEAFKGVKEKDTTIQFLRQENSQTATSATSLKQQLEEFKRNPPKPGVDPAAAAAAAAAAIPAEVEIDVSGIELLASDEDALLDPENRKKLANSLKSVVEGVRAVNKRVAQTDQKATSIQTAAADAAEIERIQVAERKANAKEFQEIEELYVVEPSLKPTAELQPGVAPTFGQLDAAVHKWMVDVGVAAGTGGVWDEPTFKAVRTYYSQTPEGEVLRKACADRHIVMPADINKHTAVMQLHSSRSTLRDSLRQQMESVAGRQLKAYEVPDSPLSMSDIYLRERTRGNDVAKIVLKAVVKNHEAAARAADASAVAAEIPPERGAGPAGIRKLTDADVSALMKKHSSLYTIEEAQQYKIWCDENEVPVPQNVKDKLAGAAKT
jgi:hypothetical protein